MTEVVRKPYMPEYKREVVRLTNESSLPITQLARQPGIHRTMLDNWRKESSELGDKAFPVNVASTSSVEEM